MTNGERTHQQQRSHQWMALGYFSLSALITWWFIKSASLYTGLPQALLSLAIAAGKWVLQIAAALLLLETVKWAFIHRIARCCFAGSAMLLPYCLSTATGNNPEDFFTGSLVLAVVLMIYLYYQSVQQTGLKLYWWIGWLVSLALAIFLQLTLVFQLIHF